MYTVSFECPPPPYDKTYIIEEKPHLREQPEKQQRTRLIICVDGTYCDPDGTDTGYEGNSTNVFRVATIVSEGVVGDGEWTQKVVYKPGLNNSWWVQKKLSGAFGHGLKTRSKMFASLSVSTISEVTTSCFFLDTVVEPTLCGLLRVCSIG